MQAALLALRASAWHRKLSNEYMVGACGKHVI
jgi:hypothetical protein